MRSLCVNFRNNRQMNVLLFGAAIAGAMLFLQMPVLAQDASGQVFTEDQFNEEVPRGETVRSRQREEVDPKGIHVGGFLLYPAIRQGMEFNDNVFATENNTKSDFIYTIEPIFVAKSDWNRHNLRLELGGNLGFYFDESDENYQDFYGRLGSTIEITARNAFRINVRAERLHEARTNPENLRSSAEPTPYNRFEGGLQYVHRFNRLALAAGGLVRRLDYEDTDRVGGGTNNNDDRDRLVYKPGMRVAYEIRPDYSVFVRGEGTFVQYDDDEPASGAAFDRSLPGSRLCFRRADCLCLVREGTGASFSFEYYSSANENRAHGYADSDSFSYADSNPKHCLRWTSVYDPGFDRDRFSR